MKKVILLIMTVVLTACNTKPQEPVFTYTVLSEDKIAELIQCLDGGISPARCEYEINRGE